MLSKQRATMFEVMASLLESLDSGAYKKTTAPRGVNLDKTSTMYFDIILRCKLASKDGSTNSFSITDKGKAFLAAYRTLNALIEE